MLNCLFVAFVFVTITLDVTSGGYPCLCAYILQTTVYKLKNDSSPVLGYMYEFDCKPTFPVDHTSSNDFFTIQFNGQIGNIKKVPGYYSIESCPGDVPPQDKVLLGTTSNLQSKPSTTITTKTPRSSTTLQSTSTAFTTTTTRHPTTASTTTKQPTTTSTKTTPQPTTTSTTTTPQPTTALKTTQPTTLLKTTQPTTSLKTTQPTTSLKTTQSTTSLKTTQPTISLKTTQPTTASTTQQPTSSQTTTTAAIVTVKLVCPNGWVLYELSCYRFHLNERLRHLEASQKCRQSRSHLVHINTADEQRMIERYLKNDYFQRVIQQSADKLHGSVIWTGGVMNSKNTWVWYDRFHDDLTNMEYTNWNHLYPEHNLRYGHNNFCIGIIGNEHCTWRDFRWQDEFFFICEKRAHFRQVHVPKSSPSSLVASTSTTTRSTILSTTTNSAHTSVITKSTHGRCPHGWVHHRYSCYYINFHSTRTYYDAMFECHQQDSHLVYITSAAEQAALARLLESYTFYGARHEHKRDPALWTAGLRVSRDSAWFWRNPVTHTTLRMTYTNWARESDYRSFPSCLAIVGEYNSKWMEFSCNKKLYYICERAACH